LSHQKCLLKPVIWNMSSNILPSRRRPTRFEKRCFFDDACCQLTFQAHLTNWNQCADSHKSADNTQNKTMWKSCDNTGLMASCCQHDSVIYLANIYGTGENHTLPLTLLKKILENNKPDQPVGVLYNLGCLLEKYMNLVGF
jgi:hypothetical protein